MVKLQITCKSEPLDGAIREIIARRITFALSRFSNEIERIELMGLDENGPKGGLDKVCRLTAHLKTGEAVRVTDRASELVAAASHAADRLARAVARGLERRRDWRSSI